MILSIGGKLQLSIVIIVIIIAQTKVKRSVHTEWPELLPVAANMNLKAALKLTRMRSLLAAGSEVAINLDQDVGVQVGWVGCG